MVFHASPIVASSGSQPGGPFAYWGGTGARIS